MMILPLSPSIHFCHRCTFKPEAPANEAETAVPELHDEISYDKASSGKRSTSDYFDCAYHLLERHQFDLSMLDGSVSN